MTYKTAYGKKPRVSLKFNGPSMTQQNFKKECDINTILQKYQKTGLLEHVNTFQGEYADLSEPIDYQTALNLTITAQNSFDSLPSSLRKKFNNNPSQFLDFVNNPDNDQAMIDLGLKKAPENSQQQLSAAAKSQEPAEPDATKTEPAASTEKA